MPCEQGVQIGSIMIFKSMCLRLPPQDMVKSMGSAIQSMENCIQCHECDKKCPYDLNVLELLEENKAYYDELCEQLGK